MDIHDIQSEHTPAPEPARSNPWLAKPVIIFVLGLLMGGLLGYIAGTVVQGQLLADVAPPMAPPRSGSNEGGSGGTASIQATLMSAVVEQTRHFKGDPNAPVTIIEFSDFKCGFCGRFASDTLHQLEAEYIDTGRVRFGFQSVAYLSPESLLSAEASECAAEQGAFWEYHDLLFANLNSGNASFNDENLTRYAQDLNLDVDTFTACIESDKFLPLVRDQSETAQSLGVSGTPTFLINGQPVRGAQPFEVFQQVIEAEQAAFEQ